MNPILLNAIRASQAAAANWWDGLSDVVAVYQPIGAASLAASYVNLVNPGVNDAAPGVAPTWASATGWTSDGTRWLDTGIVPTSSYTFIYRYSNMGATANRSFLGILQSSPQVLHFVGNRSGPVFRAHYGASSANSATFSASGVLAMAGRIAYLDGSPLVTVADNVWSSHSLSYFIFALNNNGTAQTGLDGNIQAVAICSTVQSAAQIASVSAAMAAL